METTTRIFKRIVFPDAAFGTEPSLSDFQRAMLDATPDCIKVISVDGTLLNMNRAGCEALGVPVDSEFGMLWLPLLPEGVHAKGLEALHKAAQGESARFPGRSESDGETRYWDNLLTPIVDASGFVQSILCVSRDVTTKTLLEIDLEDAVSRERLLAQEMQHRIKNVFSVVSGLISLSEQEANRSASPESTTVASATKILRDKLGALSRASDAVFVNSDGSEDGRTELGPLVSSVLRPYGDRCQVLPTEAFVCRRNTTTLALLLHELATNSVKYGALSTDHGEVRVMWTAIAGELELTWIENGGPPLSASPACRGFGSDMVERIVKSVGGRIDKAWPTEGLIAKLSLPNLAWAAANKTPS